MKKIRFAVLLTISSALSVACILISQRVQVQSVAPQNDVRIKSAVKAHLKDGSTVTFLSGVTISAGKVYGEGSLSDIALTPPKPVRAIALNDVIGM